MDDTWAPTSTLNAPSARAWHTAVWTGSEMIVWGGYSEDYDVDLGECVQVYHRDGSRYNPATDTWRFMLDGPNGRSDHTAVWTGTEMIVWGGGAGSFNSFNTGGRYDSVIGAWLAISTDGALSPRRGHTAVWTGTEMVVWGGSDDRIDFDTGGRYCAMAGADPPAR